MADASVSICPPVVTPAVLSVPERDYSQWNKEYLLRYFADHPLLGSQNSKTIKGEKYGYSTKILYLLPWEFSGLGNVCSSASPFCPQGCIYWTGRGQFNAVQEARLRKTRYWFLAREAFLSQIWRETDQHVRWCARNMMVPCFRLNGTSDIMWEHYLSDLMATYPQAQWYDYSKHEKRMFHDRPSNYHLTYSRSEKPGSDDFAFKVLSNGGTVSVVFADRHFPETYLSYPVISGDMHDLTFLCPPRHVLALYAKGSRAKKDTSGFVVRDYERVIRD